MECEFRPVNLPGFKGLYEICSCGQHVKGLRSGKMLKTYVDTSGYISVSFHNKNYTKTKNPRVHNLVGNAFIIKDYPEKKYIDHINRIKTDNDVSNLRWVTIAENNNNRDLTTQNRRKVSKFDLKGNLIMTYDDCLEASKDNNINSKSLSSIIKRMPHYNKYDFVLKYDDSKNDSLKDKKISLNKKKIDDVIKNKIYSDDEIFKNIGILTLYNILTKETNTYDFSKYEISNRGNLRNLKGKIFSPTINSEYLYTSIVDNISKKRKHIYIHVLK